MKNKTRKVMYIVYMPNGISAKEAENKGYILPYSALQVRKLIQDKQDYCLKVKKVSI